MPSATESSSAPARQLDFTITNTAPHFPGAVSGGLSAAFPGPYGDCEALIRTADATHAFGTPPEPFAGAPHQDPDLTYSAQPITRFGSQRMICGKIMHSTSTTRLTRINGATDR